MLVYTTWLRRRSSGALPLMLVLIRTISKFIPADLAPIRFESFVNGIDMLRKGVLVLKRSPTFPTLERPQAKVYTISMFVSPRDRAESISAHSAFGRISLEVHWRIFFFSVGG